MDTVHECDGQTDRITITKTVQRIASHGKKKADELENPIKRPIILEGSPDLDSTKLLYRRRSTTQYTVYRRESATSHSFLFSFMNLQIFFYEFVREFQNDREHKN